MGHIIHTTNNLVGYINPTIIDNWFYKLTLGAFFTLIDVAFDTHALLLSVFFALFFLDLITGVMKAIKFNIFSSRAFFKGASKLLVYGVFIAIAESIDIITGIEVFLPIMIGYIVHTDAVSILENLEVLGFSQARPIRLMLEWHKNKYIQDKAPFLEQVVDVQRDINRLRGVYIPMIPDKTNKAMFKVKIGILEKFLNNIASLDGVDTETFKTQFKILLNGVGQELEVELDKHNFSKKEIQLFLNRHYKRVQQYKEELDRLYKIEETSVTHLKNNILQATIRIIYAGVSDNIEIGIEYTKS